MPSILLTGSEGLIGRHVSLDLEHRGWKVLRFDLRGALAAGERGDVVDPDAVRRTLSDVAGILHLAGVSRVIDGERDPRSCWRTNVGGTQNLIAEASRRKPVPWFVFASSREVYGDQANVPVSENASLSPKNVYARSKAECETLVKTFGSKPGNRALIVRLSNVYGCVQDHPTRVVPAFCRAAATGKPMVVEGPANILDLTHVCDVAKGICRLVEWRHESKSATVVVQLTTGVGTSLQELAGLANRAGGKQSQVVVRPSRSYQASRFVGQTSYAAKLIGWNPKIGVVEGVTKLVTDFEEVLGLR